LNRKISKTTMLFIILLLVTGPIRTLASEGISGLMDDIVSVIYMLPAIAIALSFHEFGHAWVADFWGDDTPARDGRVTLDPRAHIDLMGLVSLLLIHFGWGRPVRINPQRFKDRRAGLITVGLAGVTMNFLTALLFGGFIKLLYTFAADFSATSPGVILISIFFNVVYINISLMLFNLLPVPPLDGFNVIAEVFRLYNTKFYAFVRSNSYWILLVMIIFNIPSLILSGPMSGIVTFILHTIYRL